MAVFQNPNPYFLLRLSFGLSYLYSGSSMFFYPHKWYGFMPPWFSQGIWKSGFTVDGFLKTQGVLEMLVGILFLAWFLDRFRIGKAVLIGLCVFTAGQMAAILFFTGVDPITFRDIVLLGAALALLVMTARNGRLPAADN